MYAVVITYSFDEEMPVYIFPDEASAKAFLKKNFEEECRIDREENEWVTTAEVCNDGWYAKIENHFSDHNDITEFRIGVVRNSMLA